MKQVSFQSDMDARRRDSYPDWRELADAMYHLQTGNPQPMKDYVAKVKAVKDKFPKKDKG